MLRWWDGAIYSAVDNTRCPSIALDEVDNIAITVYLLKPQERVYGLEELDPLRYGVIVDGSGSHPRAASAGHPRHRDGCGAGRPDKTQGPYPHR